MSGPRSSDAREVPPRRSSRWWLALALAACALGGAVAFALTPVTTLDCWEGGTAPDQWTCPADPDGTVELPFRMQGAALPSLRVPLSALGPDPLRASCEVTASYAAGEVLPSSVSAVCGPSALEQPVREAVARDWERPDPAAPQRVTGWANPEACVERAPIGDPGCVQTAVPRFRTWLP